MARNGAKMVPGLVRYRPAESDEKTNQSACRLQLSGSSRPSHLSWMAGTGDSGEMEN
jgi:hypothetical protein